MRSSGEMGDHRLSAKYFRILSYEQSMARDVMPTLTLLTRIPDAEYGKGMADQTYSLSGDLGE